MQNNTVHIYTHKLESHALNWAIAKSFGASNISFNSKGVWIDDLGFNIEGNYLGYIRYDDPIISMYLLKRILNLTTSCTLSYKSMGDNIGYHGSFESLGPYCEKDLPLLIARLYLTSKLSNVEMPIELLTLDQLQYIVK